MATPSVPVEPAAADHWLAAILGACLLLVAVLASGFVVWTATLPDEDDGTALAVFPPTWSEARGLDAVLRAGGRPVRPIWPGFAWVANGAEAGFVGRLEDAGAVVVLGDMAFGPALAGCNINLSAEDLRALMRGGDGRRPLRTGG